MASFTKHQPNMTVGHVLMLLSRLQYISPYGYGIPSNAPNEMMDDVQNRGPNQLQQG